MQQHNVNFLWSQNFQQSAPHNGGIPTMLVTELARSLDQVQPSPPFFPEFPFIVNLNSMKQRPQWSFPLDFQLSNQQYFFFFLWCLFPSLQGETQAASLVNYYFNWLRKKYLCFAVPYLVLGTDLSLTKPSISLSAVSSDLLPFCTHAPLHRLLYTNLSLRCRNMHKAATSFTSKRLRNIAAPREGDVSLVISRNISPIWEDAP